MILGTLAIGEVAARALGVHPLTTKSLIWDYHVHWGWFHRPDAEDIFVKPGFAQHVRINSQGLRERPIPYEKPDGTFRILVIGDSSVVSFEVAPERVFTRVAEELLQQRGFPVEIVNGGSAATEPTRHSCSSRRRDSSTTRIWFSTSGLETTRRTTRPFTVRFGSMGSRGSISMSAES